MNITDKQISIFIKGRFNNLEKEVWKDEMKAEFDLAKATLIHFGLVNEVKPSESGLNKHVVVGSFFNRISHIGKKYYYGRMVRGLLADKKGKSIYCDKCGNIANGIEEGRVLGLRYRIPLCKVHLSD